MSCVKTIGAACVIAALVLFSAVAGEKPASAATLLWCYSTAGIGGSAVDGSGTWDTVTDNWFVEGDINPIPAGYSAWERTPWVNDGTWDAQIGWGGTPGTITLASTTNVDLHNITFGGPTTKATSITAPITPLREARST
jgi:hypothetical protein